MDLILARTIHIAAVLMAAGIVFFGAFVAEPAFARAGGAKLLAARVLRRVTLLFWLALAAAAISWIVWLIVLAQQISGGTLTAVFLDRIVLVVLTRTDFGTVWIVRLVIGVLLAVIAAAMRRPVLRAMAIVLAACLVGSLGYAGHAAAGIGIEGTVHLAADILHLLGSAAWAGALIPLAMLLQAAGRDPDATAIEVSRAAVQRFSTLGIASVAAIVVSGIVNTYELAGSVPALFGTDYGHLLLVKIALFLVMFAVAAVNRTRLTPLLVVSPDATTCRTAMSRLRTNCIVEAGLAAIIIAIVGVLGTLPPGLEEASP